MSICVHVCGQRTVLGFIIVNNTYFDQDHLLAWRLPIMVAWLAIEPQGSSQLTSPLLFSEDELGFSCLPGKYFIFSDSSLR